ncbi:cytosolic 5'-nucleotidase 1A [Gadus chalcogrammus]|uniref:cytosolic 5'-nucleotidase 1A n=1 Tax=Gadus chalcogrammus TaxID=1042646 RepID=UPI0024C48F8C|nr:cytosolic 5'-nucleotidase 1A [Gadus chalcogrammus]
MVSTVLNTEVEQRDSAHSMVVAVAFHAVFEAEAPGGDGPTTSPYAMGAAFPFIQAIQRVNERLLEKNPSETLLFDIILISTEDTEEHQTCSLLSLKHYALEISRLCFCAAQDLVEGLRSNNVKLFLSTDSSDVWKASQGGIAGAQVVQQTALHSTEQLRVGFYGHAEGFPDDCTASPSDVPDSQEPLREFSALVGRMRQRFGVEDSPLTTSLITGHGTRNTCLQALKTLRSWGLAVDEAYCLAGAPKDPILSLVKPHILVTVGPHSTHAP